MADEPLNTQATGPVEAAAPNDAPVTFTAEQMAEANRIAEERARRASGAALKSYFQQQGMSEDDAKAALDAYKAQKAAEKTPEQLAQEAQQTANTRIEAAKRALIRVSAQAAAVQLGVRPERVDYALKLADLSGVEVGDDMAVNQEAAVAALKAVLNDLPETGGRCNEHTGGQSGRDATGGRKRQSVEQGRLQLNRTGAVAPLRSQTGGETYGGRRYVMKGRGKWQ